MGEPEKPNYGVLVTVRRTAVPSLSVSQCSLGQRTEAARSQAAIHYPYAASAATRGRQPRRAVQSTSTNFNNFHCGVVGAERFGLSPPVPGLVRPTPINALTHLTRDVSSGPIQFRPAASECPNPDSPLSRLLALSIGHHEINRGDA